MTDTARFWDKRADKYAASPISDIKSYEYTLERTRSYLGDQSKVLEIGCGTGSTALLLAPSVGEIVGTDFSSGMIRIATEKAQKDGVTNAAFRVASARQAADLEGFDAMLAFNLFHLVPDTKEVIAAIHRHLEPGGLFISKTPCLAEPSIGLKRFAFAAMIPAMRLVGLAPFVQRYAFKELEGMIAAAGFELIETGSFPAMSRYIVARRR